MKSHPYLSMVPEIAKKEFDDLRADINQFGQMFPVITCNGVIIDGRARWRACTMLDRKPKIEERDLSEMQILDFVISANVHRRHLTKSQIAVIVGLPYMREKAKLVAAEKAEKNRIEKLNRGKVSSPRPLTYRGSHESKTAKQTADVLGVNASILERAKTVEKKAPELIPPIARGETSVKAAYETLRQPKPEPPAPEPDAAEYVIDRSQSLVASIKRSLERAAKDLHTLHEECKMRQIVLPEEIFSHLVTAGGDVITINNYFREFNRLRGVNFVGSRETIEADWEDVK
jgi:ParB-like chromosome segregation protein Spo0J